MVWSAGRLRPCQEGGADPARHITGTLLLPAMSSQHVLNFDDNVYLAFTVSPTSRFMANPEQLAVHPSLTHLGTVGQLQDVQLLSAPRAGWSQAQGEVLSSLNGLDGVKRVDIQDPPRERFRRGDDL